MILDIKDFILKIFLFRFTGTETKCLNLGSYNYLGFASNDGQCADNSIESIRDQGVAFSSPRSELGLTPLHKELEKLTAQFLGTEDAITFGMGFATNSLNIPALLSPGCLVISDEKNHASIILGLRLSGATIKVFRHNDMEDLEHVLEKAVVNGQPKTGTQWKKILIVVNYHLPHPIHKEIIEGFFIGRRSFQYGRINCKASRSYCFKEEI